MKNSCMDSSAAASSSGFKSMFICFLTVAAINAWACFSKEFIVGDKDGWREPPPGVGNETYSEWSSQNRFHIGDSLRFVYTNDSVLDVDKWGFYHCNTSDAIATFHDGNNTVIKLRRPGPVYFISGYPGHCKSGQSMMVVVINPKSDGRSQAPTADHPSSRSTAAAPLIALSYLSPVVIVFNILGLLCHA